MHWLSYGGGVNSTALAILLVQGALPQYAPFRFVFADTGEEKAETYAYIAEHFAPWCDERGVQLDTVRPAESVLERWERLHVTGSRLIRACTVEGKIKPIERHVAANGGGVQLIGIDAGEAHRMPGAIRPLVDLGIDREGCEEIIREAGLPSPGKSGCWCCPFMRVQEVIRLAKVDPCRFARIKRLEQSATDLHGLCPDGSPRTQWGDKPAAYWEARASAQVDFIFDGLEPVEPCGCML